MGILGNVFGRFKKAPASYHDEAEHEDDLPVMGRSETLDASSHQTKPKIAHKTKAQSHYQEDENENEGLPSVNRRSNSKVNIIGLAVILVIGIIAIFSLGGNSNNKLRSEQRKADISSHLPPLDFPAPKQPEPLALEKPTAAVPDFNSAEAIPLQNNSAAKPSAVPPDWTDRKLAGGVLISTNTNLPSAAPAPTPEVNPVPNMPKSPEGESAYDAAKLIGSIINKPETPKEDLNEKLKPTITKGIKAELLPNRNFVIAKGTALDCALETAIDTTVPGLITCRLTRDVYSDNGRVVMLDRGSQLVGEYKGGIKDGQARVFVLWTRAKTPNGVLIALDSPGTDALGRGGIGGWVDNHYAERFGAAILTSIIKDTFVTIANLSAQKNNDGTIVSFGNTSDTSEKMGVEILKHTLSIPPTLHVNQGSHVQIMVARDLDFTSVYKLELVQ